MTSAGTADVSDYIFVPNIICRQRHLTVPFDMSSTPEPKEPDFMTISCRKERADHFNRWNEQLKKWRRAHPEMVPIPPTPPESASNHGKEKLEEETGQNIKSSVGGLGI
ncbi:hypothetical protein CVT26_006234 [Gymnopilus dilepis]|uniref:Uncharacterized protein n=1 Tax=Gymnopilus dilepis TaxID=231916 RepID=A0A409Y1D9_9AGAR|nr:hypothetical protein CVT26_006234 [Gymnopilus dilepis]